HRAVPESELPVKLPDLDDFKPTGMPEPPLSKATAWVRYSERYRRETNTMPQWAGSCWYYLRFLDPHNDQLPWDPAKERYWMPVDLYVGGAEHAVLHLLYSRFWHKVLYDRGLVSTPEAFQKLVNQGMILGEVQYRLFSLPSGEPISVTELEGKGINVSALLQGEGEIEVQPTGDRYTAKYISEAEVEKRGDRFYLTGT